MTALLLHSDLFAVCRRQQPVTVCVSCHRTSFVKVSKLFTTHPTLVLKKVCAIKPARLNVVLKELRRFFQ